MKTKRHHVPCRNCGNEHLNPASSSLCDNCGPAERIDNLKRKAEIKELERVHCEGVGDNNGFFEL